MVPQNHHPSDSIQQPTGSVPRAAAAPPAEAAPRTEPPGPAGEGDHPVHAMTSGREMESRLRAIVELAPDAMVVADRDGHITLVNRQTEALFGYVREQLLGQPVEVLIPEQFHTAHQQHRAGYTAAPHTRPMGADLQLFGRRHDGSEFPVEVSLSSLKGDSEFAVISSIRDVSALQRIHAAWAATEATNQELGRLQALTDTALSHLALDDLLRELLALIMSVMGVEDVGILLLDADGQQLRLRAACGLEDAVTIGATIPVGQGVSGRVAATRAPLIVNDLSDFPVFYSQVRETEQSAACIPLLVEERLLGVVYVGSATPRHFTEADVQFLQRAADRIALAIDRASAYEAAQAARAKAERQAEQLDCIFEALADALIVYDAQGRIVRVNAATRGLLGLDAAPAGYFQLSLAERNALFAQRDEAGHVLAPEDLPMARALRGETLTGSNAAEGRIRTLDGREIETTTSAAPLHDSDGHIVGAVGILRDITERKRLVREREEALQRSEAWFHTMADTAPVLLWVSDTDALVTLVNTRWLQFTGRHLEQEVGNGWAEGVHPDDYERCLQTYLTAFRARQRFTMEYRLRRFDGEYRWMVDNGVPRFAPDGSFAGYIGSAIDITEHKRLERALQASEARYRDLLESQTEMICRYLPDTTLTFVNEAFCRCYGRPREELIGRRFLDLIDESGREHHEQYGASLLLLMHPHTSVDEHEVVLPDGSIGWQQWVDHAICDAEGHVVEIQAIGRDVTERKQADEALRASEARSRAVVRNLPHSAVLLFDAELRHSFADGPGLQVLGLTPEGLEGRTVLDAFQSDLAATLAPLYEAALSGQAVAVDVAHAQHTYHVQVVPMLATAAAPTRAGMVVLQDVTEQRRTRDELEHERTRAALLGALSQEFRTLAEHSPDLIARFDREGRIRYINESGAELLGMTAEHCVGKTLAELGMRKTDYEPWAQAMQEVLETRVPRTLDGEVQAPDGQVRSLHVRSVPEFADDGAILSVLGIATDVSALKHVEARLAEQASELEAIFEAQADGVAVYDLQGRFVRANSALRHLLGFDADVEYTARPLEERAQRLQLFDEQGQPILPEQWPHWRVLRGEILVGASALEGRVRTVDGRDLWISTTGAPVRAPNGRVTGTVLITRDVTVRRALERQVAEQASQLAATFEAMADGVFVLNADGHVTRINAASHALFGPTAGDGLTDTTEGRAQSLDLRDADGRPLPLEQLPTQRVLRGEVLAGDDAVTLKVRTHDGRERTISLTGGPLRDAMGQIVGGVGVVRDVTELQRVQAALAEQERLFRTLVEHSPDIIARFDRELRYLYVSPAIRQVSPVPEVAYLGKTNSELGWPEVAYGPSHRAIEQVFQMGQPQTLEERDAAVGDPETVRYFRAQILPECGADGRVESVLTVTTDITALKRTEQALREANASIETARQEEERRKQIAESLRGMLTVLNSTRSPREVLQYIVGQVEDLLGSAAAVIYGPDDLADSMASGARAGALASLLRVQAAQGLQIGDRRPRPHQRLTFTEPAVEQVLASAQPVALVVNDVIDNLIDDRGGPPSGGASGGADDEANGNAADGTVANRAAAISVLTGSLPGPYRALLVVPIRVHDGIYGCLLLFYTQPCRFLREEVAQAQAYADQVAQAITNARLQAHIEQEATAAERNRLARELHDTMTQEIFSASLLAEAIPKLWRLHRAEAEEALQKLHGITRGALAGLRALLFELRPTTLERLPLAEALRQLGEATSPRAGVPIGVHLEGAAGVEPPLPAAVKVAFYRVAQEALMNAAKHAQARAISLRLRTLRTTGAGDGIELEVRDDGQGFDPGAAPAGHFGLAMMRERAQAIGAAMHLRSEAGHGTQVVVEWQQGRQWQRGRSAAALE